MGGPADQYLDTPYVSIDSDTEPLHKSLPTKGEKTLAVRGDSNRGWNFKELLHSATNLGSPEVELRFCPWLAVPELFSLSLLCVCVEGRGLSEPQVTGPQMKYCTCTQND